MPTAGTVFFLHCHRHSMRPTVGEVNVNPRVFKKCLAATERFCAARYQPLAAASRPAAPLRSPVGAETRDC